MRLSARHPQRGARPLMVTSAGAAGGAGGGETWISHMGTAAEVMKSLCGLQLGAPYPNEDAAGRDT